jgi:hypothetical protein
MRRVLVQMRDAIWLNAMRWHMAYGIWHMAYGIWHMAYGIWHMAYGIWHMAYRKGGLHGLLGCKGKGKG